MLSARPYRTVTRHNDLRSALQNCHKAQRPPLGLTELSSGEKPKRKNQGKKPRRDITMLYAALQQKMGEKKPPGGGLNGASGLSLSANLTHIPAHTDERID
jgi:hypothetical protein